VLTRDRFGKKPLFYAQVGDTLIFGSELQAVTSHDLVGLDIDEEAIDEYLTFGYISAPRSAFAAVRKVPPGHTLVFRDCTATVERYWRLRYEPKLQNSLPEAEAEIRRLVDKAVERRLISDVPLGAFLSGGLDSSTVVAYMAKHSTQPVKTFSVGFKDKTFDELEYARIVAKAFATDHHEFVVDAEHADMLPMLARHLGEPFADSSIIPTFQVAQLTRSFVTVALNGDGGDELFAGYDRYRATAMANAVTSRLPSLVVSGLANAADALPLPARLPRVIHRVRRFASALGESADERYLRWGGYFFGKSRALILGERLRRFDVNRAAESLRSSALISGATDPAELFMAADALGYLPDDLLVKVDIATMACSLEGRSPLLDHELAEFVAALPASYKFSLGQSKILLRRAMRGVVPDAILDRRRKFGFSAPIGAWLRGPLRGMFQELTTNSVAVDRGFVTQSGVDQLFHEHVSGRADRTMQLWSLLMLELWFREVADARPARDGTPVAGGAR
jgi:asparagine synthase (glutamine-hydrolysing)